MARRVTLLYVRDCPSWRLVDRRLRGLVDRTDIELEHVEVGTAAQAEALGFRGSPTLLVDGVDPFDEDDPGGLACRLYATPEGLRGVPTREQLRAALR